jgi:predicted ATPase/class 3 adenylate cyclase/DNA-binding CsgD family transcriptional regulator
MFAGARGLMLTSMSATEWSDLDTGGDMAELLPTGTVTLLLADVEGSTQLWATQPEAMTVTIARMNQTASGLVAEHGGVRPVEQGEGDSFVAAFACAGDAVVCALDLQRADLAPIKLRIGVHTGDVQLRDEGNYAGTTINKTARLRDLAHGGQTVLSSVTADVVEDRLPDGVWLIDLGRHHLRNLPRPVGVAQLCHPELRNDFPPLRTTNAVADHHLPVQLTSFVGRGAQIDEIRRILADNRLVTLTGAGGAGKTRLAIEVAGQMTPAFPEGIWYADLAPITHPEVVPVAVARALGLPDQPGRSINETLLRYVRDRRMLVVLDNCEHLLECSAALVNDLLAASTTLTILATSREPLIVAGEVNWQVPSLSLADEAIELFADRARRARPDFAVTDANSENVAEICRRLDGIPLAIELAAARVRALTLDEIVDSLHDRFRLLTGGARTAVRRQQTLRASVDWSHALLSESERALFRRLAAFMGGFDLDAAQAVASDTDVERFLVLDQLSLLVDKSLVVAENADGRTRYRLLETVRQYAMEKLGESGEAHDVRARHRDHYTSAAARLDAPARDDYERLLAQAEADFDNLRAAFAWSRENDDVTRAVELASSLMPIWLTRGRVSEGVAWLDAAGADSEHAEPAAWARAMADRAVLGSWVDISGVLEPAQQALAIARDVNEPTLLVRVVMACAFINMHDAEKARPYFAEAAELARTLGDSWRLSQILSRQSTGAMLVGDAVATALYGEEGCALADAIGDRFNARQCRLGIAWAHMARGETATAMSQYADLIAEARSAHDVMSLVSAVVPGAFAHAFRGDVDGARATAATALEACTELGFLMAEAYAGIVMADLAAGDGAAALAAAETAMQSDTNIAVQKHNWWTAAHAALACGDTARARRWADGSTESTSGMFLALALAARARVHIALGDDERAAADAYDGLAIAAPMAGYLCVPDLLECLAEVGRDAGNLQHATRLVGAAHAMRQRLELPRFKVYDAGHEALLAAMRKAMGDSEFDDALAEGEALPAEEAVAYALRGRGERKRPSSGWGSLTPTELDVVRLVAEGIPNKDIATRLFVSPRTVQSHLRHVYNKLGLISRVQLAQEAGRHG